MAKVTHARKKIGGLLTLSVVGLWIGQALLQNKADAQRAEAQGYVLSTADGEKLYRGGGEILIKVDPTKGSNSVALGTQQIPAGGRIPTHRHAQMDEVFYVVEGSGTLQLNDASLNFTKGSTVFIPKGAWHGFDKTEKEVQLVWAVAPPGLEGMFREIASRAGEAPKQFSLEQLNNIARKYGGTEYK
jgi:quercetin dioxygenase-like cupin family protein